MEAVSTRGGDNFVSGRGGWRLRISSFPPTPPPPAPAALLLETSRHYQKRRGKRATRRYLALVGVVVPRPCPSMHEGFHIEGEWVLERLLNLHALQLFEVKLESVNRTTPPTTTTTRKKPLASLNRTARPQAAKTKQRA